MRMLITLEEPRPILRRDANAVIADRDAHTVIGCDHGDLDRSAVRTELHRVVDEIADDLLNAQRIHCGLGVARLDPYISAFVHRADLFRDVLHEFAEVDELMLDRETTSVEADI